MAAIRLFVGGLREGIKEQEVERKFKPFGRIQSVDVHVKKDSEGQIAKTFAYVNFAGDQRKCLSTLNGQRWNGQLLQVQIAKEKFTDRLKQEQVQHAKSAAGTRQPGTKSKSTDKNVLSGKLVPRATRPDQHKWVQNEQGNLEPILNIKRPDKMKIIKHDPSMGKSSVKKLDTEGDGHWETPTNPKSATPIHNSPTSPKVLTHKEFNLELNSMNKCKSGGNRDILRSKEVVNYKGKGESLDVVTFSDSDEECISSQKKQKKGGLTPSSLSGSKAELSSGEDTDDLFDRLRTNEKSSSKVGVTSVQNTSHSKKRRNVADFESGLDSGLIERNRSSRYNSSSSEDEDDYLRNRVQKPRQKKPQVKEGQNQRIVAVAEEVNSDSESDIVDFEAWMHNNYNTRFPNSTPALTKSAPALTNSTSIPSGNCVQKLRQKKPEVKKDKNHKKVAVVEEVNSDSESDVPDIEAWMHKNLNKKIPNSSPALNKSSPALTNSTSIPSGIENVVKLTKSQRTYISENTSIQNKSNLNDSNSGKTIKKSKEDNIKSAQNTKPSPFVKISNERHKSSNVVPRSQSVDEFGSGFTESHTQSFSSSDEEDLLDSIASGKLHKVKEIQKKNRLKQQEKLEKKWKDIEARKIGKGTSFEVEFTTKGSKVASETSIENCKDASKSGDLASMEKQSGPSSAGKPVSEKEETELKHKLSNTQRLESLKERQRQSALQKSAVQKALANVDGVEKNKKIVFDSDSSEQEEEVVPNHADAEVVEKPSLFSGSTDSEGSEVENDTERFSIKPQFEGRKGSKLMKLQTRFKGDQRFKMGSQFAESDSDSASEMEETKKKADKNQEDQVHEITEKEQNLKVLESVVGKKLSVKKSKKNFQDLIGVHYDPSREDHAEYEIQMTQESRVKKKKVKLSAPVVEEPPEVSKEKFYEVRTSLKDVFAKPADEGPVGAAERQQTDEADAVQEKPFSLLAMFGPGQDSQQQDDSDASDDMAGQTADIVPVKTLPWQQGFDSSGEEDNTQVTSTKKSSEKVADVSKSSNKQQTFFFTSDDPRLKEGLDFFQRQESLEKLREAWLEKRPVLVEAYRTRRKRSLRKRRTAEVFHTRLNKKRKFNNQKKSN